MLVLSGGPLKSCVALEGGKFPQRNAGEKKARGGDLGQKTNAPLDYLTLLCSQEGEYVRNNVAFSTNNKLSDSYSPDMVNNCNICC